MLKFELNVVIKVGFFFRCHVALQKYLFGPKTLITKFWERGVFDLLPMGLWFPYVLVLLLLLRLSSLVWKGDVPLKSNVS